MVSLGHNELKPFQFTVWQLPSSRIIDFYWLPAFNLVVNEGDFSVPVDSQSSFKSRHIALHWSFYWLVDCHRTKWELVVFMIICNMNAQQLWHTEAPAHHITSVAHNASYLLRCSISLSHDMRSEYSPGVGNQAVYHMITLQMFDQFHFDVWAVL